MRCLGIVLPVRKRAIGSAAIGATLTLSTACDRDPTRPVQEFDRGRPVPVLSATQPQFRVFGLDAVFTRLADEVPGFGGYYFGNDGRAVVVLTDLRQRQVAETRLRALVRDERFVRSGVRFRQGQYDFRSLSTWKGQLTRQAGAIPGWVTMDADEMRNRIVVGVTNRGLAEPAVATAAARLGIPRAAIVVEQESPVYRRQGSLRSKWRPTYGGLSVTYTQTGEVCTLGYNVTLARFPGAVFGITNSHCTARSGSWTDPGGVDGTQFYQPGIPDAAPQAVDFLGTESIDPTWTLAPATLEYHQCPIADDGRPHRCRLSDAALFRYANSGDAALNYILRPAGTPDTTYRGPVDTSAARRTINSTSPIMQITGGNMEPMAGDSTTTPPGNIAYFLHKVGAQSGWTAGRLQRTCVDVAVTDPETGQLVGTVLLCQQFSRGKADSGDSGAFVFTVPSGDPSLGIKSYGLMWGSRPATATRDAEIIWSDNYNIDIEICFGCSS
jgi:hypothetical protein